MYRQSALCVRLLPIVIICLCYIYVCTGNMLDVFRRFLAMRLCIYSVRLGKNVVNKSALSLLYERD